MRTVAAPSIRLFGPGIVPLDVGLAVNARNLEPGALVRRIRVVHGAQRPKKEVPNSSPTALEIAHISSTP